MAVKSTVVSVATTATRLDDVTVTGSESIAVYNDGAATVYVGGVGVTTSGATKGAPVLAGSWGPAFDLEGGEGLYGIVVTGTVSAIVLECGI